MKFKFAFLVLFAIPLITFGLTKKQKPESLKITCITPEDAGEIFTRAGTCMIALGYSPTRIDRCSEYMSFLSTELSGLGHLAVSLSFTKNSVLIRGEIWSVKPPNLPAGQWAEIIELSHVEKFTSGTSGSQELAFKELQKITGHIPCKKVIY